ncbi:peptidase G1 domain-containing protein [Phanerochaete sordida]|uniref:Peptidase G1 domain-containing protein n=1 Tax=Phanerochaete sordida TaxID=48140 RepID=A0A9P3GMW1_9APHY|nr:peptidase G1 domain-containing protein [Phanerochaete sordida]
MLISPIITPLTLAVAACAGPTAHELFATRVAERASAAPRFVPQDVNGGTRSRRTRSWSSTRSEAAATYSQSFAGAVLSAPADTWNSVEGVIAVPIPTIPDIQNDTPNGTFAASAWVGIDGVTCANASLRAGVDFVVDSSGAVSYTAWHQWLPDDAVAFSNFTVNADDSILLFVEALSPGLGLVLVENLSSGQLEEVEVEGSNALCEQDAEWIVGAAGAGLEPLPLANFGSVPFIDVSATKSNGQTANPGDAATVFEIVQNGIVLTNTSANATAVVVSFV